MMKRSAILVAGLLAAGTAAGGVFDECNLRGDQATVTRCLVDAEREAQEQLNRVEGDVARKARELDTATGRPLAGPALARSMREFAGYRKAQCEFVRAMYPGGARGDQAQLGCMVDMTRRRVRDLQN